MKKIIESRSVLSDIMLPSQANPAGIVHGGEIMKMMDNCGGVAAMRHARTNVVTVRVDELVFYQSIFVGQLVICEAELIFTGRTSMEVQVTVKVEDLMCEACTRVALTAYFTFVALGPDGKPCQVPQLLVETEEEIKAFEKGRIRYFDHKKHQKTKPV
jgi:acyl-CoA hydrolase